MKAWVGGYLSENCLFLKERITRVTTGLKPDIRLRYISPAKTNHWKTPTLSKKILRFALAAAVLMAFCSAESRKVSVESQKKPKPVILFISDRALDGSDHPMASRAAGRFSYTPSNVWVLDDDGLAHALTRLTASSIQEAVWSPNGSKIAFASNRAPDGKDSASAVNIWTMNADGSDARALTKFTAGSCGDPVWSPDGTKIAFVSSRSVDGSNANIYTDNIWVVNADGSGLKPVTKLTHAKSDQPAWSPDGRKIAFRSRRALNGSDAVEGDVTDNIWVMNSDGSSPTPLTHLTYGGHGDLEFNWNPMWSPDGNRLVFASTQPFSDRTLWLRDPNDPNHYNWEAWWDHHNRCIWAVNGDGSNVTPLEKTLYGTTGGGSSNPVWSPDGTKIIFSSDRRLDGDKPDDSHSPVNIWIVNADGSSITALTRHTDWAGSFNPVWSPDGTRIAFEACNIWVMKADGSDAAPVTRLTRACSKRPKWRPQGD